MKLTNLQFLNAGYCVQNEFFTGTGTFHWRKFYAAFVSFEHPIHGRCLIDTGYGPMFLNATRQLPGWLMRHLLYTSAKQPVFQAEFLKTLRIEPTKISHVFLSHYHADHIGGLSRYPDSKLVCRTEPLQWLQSASKWKQTENGFLAQLFPDDFSQHLLAVEEKQFQVDVRFDEAIPCLDYWGDGSVVLMDLPGHAIGHTGYVLDTDQGKIGYVVDAFWDVRTFNQNRRLPFLARRLQHDAVQYQLTQDRLRDFRQRTGTPLLACHCNETQRHVKHAN